MGLCSGTTGKLEQLVVLAHKTNVISTERSERRNLFIQEDSNRKSFVKTLYVYIMASKSGTLYVGVTSDIRRRAYEHKQHLIPGFTDKYDVDRLLYIEQIRDPASAIKREKQIKRWRREKKVTLIDSVNPGWNDLSEDWYD